MSRRSWGDNGCDPSSGDRGAIDEVAGGIAAVWPDRNEPMYAGEDDVVQPMKVKPARVFVQSAAVDGAGT